MSAIIAWKIWFDVITLSMAVIFRVIYPSLSPVWSFGKLIKQQYITSMHEIYSRWTLIVCWGKSLVSSTSRTQGKIQANLGSVLCFFIGFGFVIQDAQGMVLATKSWRLPLLSCGFDSYVFGVVEGLEILLGIDWYLWYH